LSDYLQKVEDALPRRINKDDLVEIFTSFGLTRSYKLRAQIAGKFKPQRQYTQKEL